ncbi:MAG: aminoglycoside phosphotransferase family protein, partial [Alphaproteobacteria bacterium]|nr:aminoglycoside phosphotransferase family protein [Alphaproteobacteria bacterium]
SLIEGTQYSQLSSPLSVLKKKQLAEDLALFLKELHSTKTSLPVWQFSAEEYGISEETIKRSSALSNEEKTELLNILRTFETYDLKEDNIVLSHTDLNENNFLLKENRLVGVIDFGNACRRDLSSEFATLMKWDFDLVQKIAFKYEEITGRKVDLSYALLLQKIRCYGGILESKENDQSTARYRRWLERLERISL